VREKNADVQTHTRIDFEHFYKEHANAVYTYCLRRVGAEQAKDATADVFVVAWRRWGAVPEGDAAVGWLYGVARNVLRARQRSIRRRGRLVEKVAAQPEPLVDGPELQVVRLAEHEAVLAALGKLPKRDREIILLVEWEGLSREQVAEMMSVTRAAIDKRMARAYKKMARSLRFNQSTLPTSRVPVEEGGEA
jgi:RNA polymerase sigma-70 factor (ECF subfamily)